jgi:hypothetical protein
MPLPVLVLPSSLELRGAAQRDRPAADLRLAGVRLRAGIGGWGRLRHRARGAGGRGRVARDTICAVAFLSAATDAAVDRTFIKVAGEGVTGQQGTQPGSQGDGRGAQENAPPGEN